MPSSVKYANFWNLKKNTKNLEIIISDFDADGEIQVITTDLASSLEKNNNNSVFSKWELDHEIARGQFGISPFYESAILSPQAEAIETKVSSKNIVDDPRAAEEHPALINLRKYFTGKGITDVNLQNFSAKLFMQACESSKVPGIALHYKISNFLSVFLDKYRLEDSKALFNTDSSNVKIQYSVEAKSSTIIAKVSMPLFAKVFTRDGFRNDEIGQSNITILISADKTVKFSEIRLSISNANKHVSIARLRAENSGNDILEFFKTAFKFLEAQLKKLVHKHDENNSPKISGSNPSKR